MLASRGAFIVLLAVALGCTAVEPASAQSTRELDQVVNDDVVSAIEPAGANRQEQKPLNVVWGNTVYYNLPTWNLLQFADVDGTLSGIGET